MQLVFYPALAGAPVPLTGDLGEEGAIGLAIDHRRLLDLDLDPEVEADALAAEDLGNRSNTLTFSVERTHTSPAAAAEFLITHPDTLPETGRLRIRCQEPGGQVTAERWLGGAGISGCQGTFDGCMTRITYNITGGRITTT